MAKQQVATKQNIDFKGTMGKLVAYCKPHIPLIVVALLLSVVGTIFTIVGPSKLKDMTDHITKGLMGEIDMDAVSSIGILLAVLYGLSVIFSFFQGYIMATVTQKVSKSLRTRISQKINKLPLKYFDSTSNGDVLSRVTNDIDTIGQTMNQSVGMLVTSVTMLVGSLVMMFYTNVWMTLTAIISTFLGFAFMTVMIKKSQTHFVHQQANLGAMNGHVEEIYSGYDVVKVYNGERKAKETFNQINDKLYESSWKSQFLSGLTMPLMMFVGNFGYVSVCIVGGALAMNGHISFGVIVAFMLYVRLFTQPLGQIAQAATSLQSTAAAAARVLNF